MCHSVLIIENVLVIYSSSLPVSTPHHMISVARKNLSDRCNFEVLEDDIWAVRLCFQRWDRVQRLCDRNAEIIRRNFVRRVLREARQQQKATAAAAAEAAERGEHLDAASAVAAVDGGKGQGLKAVGQGFRRSVHSIFSLKRCRVVSLAIAIDN